MGDEYDTPCDYLRDRGDCYDYYRQHVRKLDEKTMSELLAAHGNTNHPYYPYFLLFQGICYLIALFFALKALWYLRKADKINRGDRQ